jgi:hypothetical protein
VWLLRPHQYLGFHKTFLVRGQPPRSLGCALYNSSRFSPFSLHHLCLQSRNNRSLSAKYDSRFPPTIPGINEFVEIWVNVVSGHVTVTKLPLLQGFGSTKLRGSHSSSEKCCSFGFWVFGFQHLLLPNLVALLLHNVENHLV